MIEEEDSPYPEIRASVSNTNDPEMPTLTIRVGLSVYPVQLVFSLLAS